MKKIALLLTEAELAALRSSLQNAETDFKNRYCRECEESTFVNPHKTIRERVDSLVDRFNSFEPKYMAELLSLTQSDVQKGWYINSIKDIIQRNGETSTQELESTFSPTVESNDEFRSTVEGFYEHHVRVVTYDNGCNAQLSESDIPYELLDEDTLCEIFEILHQYDVDMEKTMKRCEG